MQIVLERTPWDKHLFSLSPRSVKVFIAFTLRMDESGDLRFKMQDFAQTIGGCCLTTLNRAIKQLEAHGMIRIVSHRRGAGSEMVLKVKKPWATWARSMK